MTVEPHRHEGTGVWGRGWRWGVGTPWRGLGWSLGWVGPWGGAILALTPSPFVIPSRGLHLPGQGRCTRDQEPGAGRVSVWGEEDCGGGTQSLGGKGIKGGWRCLDGSVKRDVVGMGIRMGALG